MTGFYSKQFCISEVSVVLASDQSIKISESFRPFAASDGVGYYAEFLYVPDLKPPDGECLYNERKMTVLQGEGGAFYRIFRNMENGDALYAVGHYDFNNRRIEVRYNDQGKAYFIDSTAYFSVIAWESILMHENRMVIHAACVDTQYGGILFAGPSGIGKSTQAELWHKYEHARQINGDRPILHRKDDGWWAYGSPYAGSSGVHVNDCCKVRAVVILQQAKNCELRRLRGIYAFRRIISGLTVNSWDGEFVRKACDCAESIMKEVPVFEFSCTPDCMAVDALKTVLEKGVLLNAE